MTLGRSTIYGALGRWRDGEKSSPKKLQIMIVSTTTCNNQHIENTMRPSIGATTVGTGETGPQLLGWGPTMYWSPNFLAVVFKKQKISQQVVTRMQDLASDFTKISRGWYPHSGRGRPPPAPNTQPGLWPGAGRKRPVLGPKPCSPPQLFSRGCPRLWVRRWLSRV